MPKLPPFELRTLLKGVAMGESPRWHEGRLWFSDWGAQEINAVDLEGRVEVMVRTSFGLPFCIDWLPDGRLLIVAGREGRVLIREADGALVPYADLRGLSNGAPGTRSSSMAVATSTSTAAPESSSSSARMVRRGRWPTASPSPMAWR